MKKYMRMRRIIRLRFLLAAFRMHEYIELKGSILRIKNKLKEAEGAKRLAEILLPGREVKMEDFLHGDNKLADEIIDGYREFRSHLKVCADMGIPEETVLAFCKNEHTNRRILWMAEIDCFHYEMYLHDLFCYVNGEITADKLREGFFEILLFSGTKQPANIRRFRRSIVRLEILIDEIQTRQDVRAVRKMVYENIRFGKKDRGATG
jgi:hypothetical protein